MYKEVFNSARIIFLEFNCRWKPVDPYGFFEQLGNGFFIDLFRRPVYFIKDLSVGAMRKVMIGIIEPVAVP